MTDLEQFIPGVQIEVEECPEPMIMHAVRRTVIDFCERTGAWEEDLEPIDIESGQRDIKLVGLPEGSEVVYPVYVEVRDEDGEKVNEITPLTLAEMHAFRPHWRTAQGDSFRHYLFENGDPGTITLDCEPETSVTGGLFARVALKPTSDSTKVGDVIFRDWRDAIERGALSRLFKMSQQKWTDPKSATLAYREYRREIGRARAKIAKGRTRNAQTVLMRDFV